MDSGSWRRQGLVCARLAEECDDPHLAEQFKKMPLDLIAKAEIDELPAERERLLDPIRPAQPSFENRATFGIQSEYAHADQGCVKLSPPVGFQRRH